MRFKALKSVTLSASLTAVLLPACLAAQKPSPGKKATVSQPQTAVQQPVIPTQQSLEQAPAVPPEVSFESGTLTIVARNSSLGSILQAIQVKTGASVDMPGSPAERVAGQFGPGPARDVLSALLNGSHFNYVLMGSPQNPNTLEKVVLIAKSSDQLAVPAAQTASSAPPAQPRPGAFIPPPQEQDEMNTPESQEEMVEQPEQAPEEQAGEQNGQAAIKTPQQLLQELQRQQQSQQPPQGGPPPGAPGQPQGAPPQ